MIHNLKLTWFFIRCIIGIFTGEVYAIKEVDDGEDADTEASE